MRASYAAIAFWNYYYFRSFDVAFVVLCFITLLQSRAGTVWHVLRHWLNMIFHRTWYWGKVDLCRNENTVKVRYANGMNEGVLFLACEAKVFVTLTMYEFCNCVPWNWPIFRNLISISLTIRYRYCLAPYDLSHTCQLNEVRVRLSMTSWHSQ